LRGIGNPRLIGGAKWDRELAALRLFYDLAVEHGYLPASPVRTRSVVARDGRMVEVAELAAKDVRPSNVKWLTPRAYRLWRDVGLGGLLPGGVEDGAWRGRNDGRDMAFADLMYSSGMRRREMGTLVTGELPVLGTRRYYSGRVGRAVAKRAGRVFYTSHAALRAVQTYLITTRAQARQHPLLPS
jgi:integrase